MKKNSGAIDEIFQSFNSDTQNIINEFLEHYNEKSRVQYRNSIINLLNDLNEKDISKLKYKNYEPIKAKYEKGLETTQDKYKHAFFKYIYAHDKLKDDSGFIFNKEEEMKKFKNLIKKRSKDEYTRNDKKEDSLVLNFEQLEIIKKLIDGECSIENIDQFKLSFICYVLYKTDYKIDDFKQYIKGSDFKNGIIKPKNQEELIIPEKYWELMELLSENKNSGFTRTDELIRNLGNSFGMDNLKSLTIRKTRDANMIKCSFCGNNYFHTIDNWTAVNDTIVCLKCSESLKKKFKVERKTKIINERIEVITSEDDLNLSKYISTFEGFREKLNNYFDELQKTKNRIGLAGEKYVYEYEKKKLAGTIYRDMVDISPSNNPEKGFDILSYDIEGNEIYIEVKSEAYFDNDFYMSEKEREKGLELIKNKKKYLIYRVHNVFAKNKEDIKIDIIENIFENSEYQLIPHSWKIIYK